MDTIINLTLHRELGIKPFTETLITLKFKIMKTIINLFKGVMQTSMIVIMCVMIAGCEEFTIERRVEVSVEWQKDRHLVLLNGAQAQDMNILFLPEAYTKDKIDYFISDVCKLYSVLQKTSPYSYLMDKMNVWYAAGYPSETDSLGSKRTAFGSGIPNDRILPVEDDSIVNAVKQAGLEVDKTIVVVLVNTDVYLGYCCHYNGIHPTYIVVPARDNYFATTFIHEMGHAVGLLGDEYDSGIVATESIKTSLNERNEEGYYLNVSTSTEDVFWEMIMNDAVYVSEKTGVYVGGHYCITGLYRSTSNSVMRSHRPDYNAVGRLRIYQQIMKYHTGKAPSYEQFRTEDLAHPVIEWDWREANKNRSSTRATDMNFTEKTYSHSCIVE